MENVNKTPIWFMRQAGRYLPEYRSIRSQHPDFLKLCLNPKVASEISLQPIKRFDIDFIILFCDILVIPFALGQKVNFLKNHGPKLEPIFSVDKLNYKRINNCLNKISNVFETIQILKSKQQKQKIIGFCGGPFTVLNYMVEGGTSKKHEKIKSFILNKREKANEIIEVLIELSLEYIKKQVDSGADYIQIFESWAGLLDNEDYDDFIIKPNKIISDEMKVYSKKVKIIHFPRGSKQNYVNFVKSVYCDVISVDEEFPNKLLKIAKTKGITIQGNLNPLNLVEGGIKMKENVISVLEKFKENDHIFNLSHGIVPQTNLLHVEETIKIVRKYNGT